MPNRIHQLSSEVANQIAAGEVIERPAGAVKELVENALDAGARRIQIDIEEGGKKLIRVRDDGQGMSAGDAVLSLQRHATSKISQADDLWRVQTLGFRGEALPSLAAVSRIEITTREEGSEVGTLLVVEAGQVLDVSEIGCAPGTEISVRGLFFNTPARFKFLKSDAAEAARISEMIGHLALAYPGVSFVLKHNGNEQLRVEANGDGFNALVAVLGRDTARQMLPISTSEEFENMRVSGFTGRPQLTRANRNGQLFFVNGRIIKSRALQHAFGAAYEGLLHGRDRFPLGVVFLQVTPGAVDVNVHPTKSEVRFAREGEAHHALRVAVRDTLVGAQLAPSWGFAPNEPRDGGLYGPFGRNAPPQKMEDETPGASENRVASSDSNSFAPAPTASNIYTPPASTPNYSSYAQPAPTDDERQRFRAHLEEIRNGSRPNFEPQLFSAPEPAPKLKLRPLAQITNNSYMLCEGEDGLYIVNQHRAHERILADNAIAAAQLKAVESQRLMIPFTVEIGARAIAAVEENGKLLGDLGFETETFGGNSLLVRAVPVLVAKHDYERAFGDLLDELVSGHAGRDLEERRRALLTMLACKNAIKAGDALPMEAMQRLVDDLANVENPSICPHGQPILIKISTYELHKKFEREYAIR
ncbi:DNA mismatch repair protein MutL [Abditibacterium utsteinense]|uniref:DNA mismatch repair protein MutL n=1 Tax=Abditibacterium utsteinense TaxID=1960156 RepID=A0A2S8SVH5_9BACT|nr:DNA mismatch repair endonuclease MutL [Abditibacterium utsteinense]PQV64805.1 DNA mismatch repair protein MutL [Abditibacterium utsteinense]